MAITAIQILFNSICLYLDQEDGFEKSSDFLGNLGSGDLGRSQRKKGVFDMGKQNMNNANI